MNWARINDKGVVIEVTDIDPAGRFAPSIVWESVPADVRPNSVRAGGKWTHPPVLPPAPAPAAGDSTDPSAIELALAAKTTEIDAERERRVAAGMRYVFSDGVTGTVQLRDAKDQGNVNGVTTGGLARLASKSTEKLPFRDAENVTHMMEPAHAVQFGTEVLSWVAKQYEAAWKHKDAVTLLAVSDGATVAKVSGYAFSAGWPE